jgi:hypothetical protein
MVQEMAKKRGGEAARGTSGEQAQLVRIFLSSPGDVADERKIARELIEGQLQKHPSYRGLKLEVIAWDNPDARIPMLANETPQESVNNVRPRPSTCDIVIVILWARMGVLLPETIRKPNGERYLSGTEWEYEDAVNSPRQSKPEVLVYRRTEEPMIAMRDPLRKEKEEQFERVEAFFAKFRNTNDSQIGGINEYTALEEFKALLRQHLDELLHRLMIEPPLMAGSIPKMAASIPAAYLDWLRLDLANVELLGGRVMTLNEVYVPGVTLRRKGTEPNPHISSRKSRVNF